MNNLLEWSNDELGIVKNGQFLFVSSGYMGVKLRLSDCVLRHRGESLKLCAKSDGYYEFELNVRSDETLELYETLDLNLPIISS